jgi:hypothetical protein
VNVSTPASVTRARRVEPVWSTPSSAASADDRLSPSSAFTAVTSALKFAIT